MNKNKQSSPMGILWSYAEAHHSRFIASIILSVISVVCQMIPYFCTIAVIDMMLDGTKDLQAYLPLCLIALTAYCGKVFFGILSTKISHTAAYATLQDLREKIIQKLTRIPMGKILDTPSGEYKNLLVERIEGIEIPLAHLMPEMTANLIVPLFIIIYLFVIDWKMALLSLGTMFLSFGIMSFGMRNYEEEGAGAMAATQKMTDAVVEYIGGIEVVKTFSQSAGSYKKYADAVKGNSQYYITWMSNSQKYMCAQNVLLPSVLLTVLPGGLALWLTGHVTTQDFYTAIVFSLGLIAPILNVFSFMGPVALLGKYTSDVDNLLKEKELIHSKTPVSFTDHTIRLDHVSFSYNEEKEVLHDISMTVNPADMTAIVGPSGSGKSTIAKLIAGYQDVTDGQITLGGHPLKDIPLSQLNEQISYVSQDNFLFNRSIRENIRMGNPDATDKEVENAAKESGCDAFIHGLEHGYDTVVGSQGCQLSGGERQRIAIARAMLKDAPVVILDEATTFIDPENEALVQRSISSLTKGKTLIVIAHRLSTIVNADKIVVINHGSIEALGTHQSLLETCKLYQDMWYAHQGAKDEQ